ncbi:type IV pilus twitching motility protein PilT [Chloroflexota bacterium]
MDIREILKRMVERGASDLHLKIPSPPVFRIDGTLVPQNDMPPLEPADIQQIFETITNQEQRTRFLEQRELDFSYSLNGIARFRVNVLQQRGTLGIAFRFVPFEVPTIDELGLPQIFKDIVLKPRGLVLVTGPTGAGKSTTLAAMVNHLNENENRSIVTIEDPIEFLHPDKKSIVVQRDLIDDTESFSIALTQALRHDFDVIVIGELRDLATISTALRAAETGHLVFGTLHTNNSPQSINRIIDVFPSDQQRQVRLQLAQVLEAVASQILVRSTDGGRAAAFEIMLSTNVIKKLIRDEKTHEIIPNIEMGKLEGMQTLDQALAALVNKKCVTIEEALMNSTDPIKLRKLIDSECEEYVFQTSS